MFEVFFDTIVICTMTALVILCVKYKNPINLAAFEGLEGAELTAFCFSSRLGIFGEKLVSASMAVFAFATIIAWYYLGKQTFHYLIKRPFFKAHLTLSEKAENRVYLLFYLLAVLWGSICRLEIVWLISDLWNGLMAYPNILAILWLSSKIKFPHHKT